MTTSTKGELRCTLVAPKDPATTNPDPAKGRGRGRGYGRGRGWGRGVLGDIERRWAFPLLLHDFFSSSRFCSALCPTPLFFILAGRDVRTFDPDKYAKYAAKGNMANDDEDDDEDDDGGGDVDDGDTVHEHGSHAALDEFVATLIT
jgi:hypothetical protein